VASVILSCNAFDCQRVRTCIIAVENFHESGKEIEYSPETSVGATPRHIHSALYPGVPRGGIRRCVAHVGNGRRENASLTAANSMRTRLFDPMNTLAMVVYLPRRPHRYRYTNVCELNMYRSKVRLACVEFIHCMNAFLVSSKIHRNMYRQVESTMRWIRATRPMWSRLHASQSSSALH